jgi:uncharacterized protein
MKLKGAWATLVCVPLLVLALAGYARDSAQKSASKLRVLVVTGGHGFEKGPFFKLFEDNPDISFQAVEHPNAHALLTAEAAKNWDVLVLYDMHQEISDQAKADLVARLKDGKGLVALHHAIANYQAWPEYTAIIGAHYYLAATNVAGVAKPRSAWKEGMKFRIHVADPNHPVTRGMTDFDTHDETYKGFDMVGECHPLLTTDEPRSNQVIAWAKTYQGARVVYIQSGHDHFAYENPNYQQLLRQALRWTARQE